MSGRSGFATVDGRRIHYVVDGDGPPVVLVHGWGSSFEGNWVRSGWTRALLGRRRVVGLDVRGHGRSDKPRDGAVYGYADMAGDVLGVLDALGIERADFVGYSMGAFMGAWLLGHAPQRFGRFVLGGIGAETPQSAALAPRIAEALRAADAETITDAYGRALRAFTDAEGATSATHRDALAASALRMWPEGDPVALLGDATGAIRNPVLVVVGGDDHPYIDTVGPFLAAVPAARLLRVPHRDHLTVVTDASFVDAALDFLDGAERDER